MEQDISNYNFDGGTVLSQFDKTIEGGSSTYALNPTLGATGATASFSTRYTNVAINRDKLPLIQATFEEFNEKPELKIIQASLRVTQKEKTLDIMDLASFFHPLQDFSEYQKLTFNILPLNSINIDASNFSSTLGEVSMIFARAYYLPEANTNEKVLFWDYKSSTRNIMGQFMVLTGAVKEDLNWKGWDINPFSTYANDLADINAGGLIFTNPTEKNVKLTIILAN